MNNNEVHYSEKNISEEKVMQIRQRIHESNAKPCCSRFRSKGFEGAVSAVTFHQVSFFPICLRQKTA